MEQCVAFLANLSENIDLRFKEVDVAFFVSKHFVEKLLGNLIAEFVANLARLLVGCACIIFASQIGF